MAINIRCVTSAGLWRMGRGMEEGLDCGLSLSSLTRWNLAQALFHKGFLWGRGRSMALPRIRQTCVRCAGTRSPRYIIAILKKYYFIFKYIATQQKQNKLFVRNTSVIILHFLRSLILELPYSFQSTTIRLELFFLRGVPIIRTSQPKYPQRLIADVWECQLTVTIAKDVLAVRGTAGSQCGWLGLHSLRVKRATTNPCASLVLVVFSSTLTISCLYCLWKPLCIFFYWRLTFLFYAKCHPVVVVMNSCQNQTK